MDGALWAGPVPHFAATSQLLVIDPPGHGASAPITHGFDFAECARCSPRLGCVPAPVPPGEWRDTG